MAITDPIYRDWLCNELVKYRKSIENRPNDMVGAYRGELLRAKEYAERELLEMLQNVEDQLEEDKSKDSTVLFELKHKTLTIANHGTPFDQDGVESLMTPNVSAKTKKPGTIGNKGLGFRSLLNWADKVRIISGGFQVEFSHQHAVDFLNNIYLESEDLKHKIQSKENEEYPIATLSVPVWIDVPANVYSRFDTYIEVDFHDEKAEKDIIKQMMEIDASSILFLHKLSRIEIISPTVKKTIVKTSATPEKVTITTVDHLKNEENTNVWNIYRNEKAESTLPLELQTGEFKLKNLYNLCIAFQDDLSDNENVLFNYFRTDTAFPFPALIHGTFDLDGSRKHLVKSDVNVFLLNKLAELMIFAAKQLSKGKCDWRAFQLVAPLGKFDSPLNDGAQNFEEILHQKLLATEILPTYTGQYISFIDTPYFYPYDLSILFNDKIENRELKILKFTNNTSVLNFLEKVKKQRNATLKMPDTALTKEINDALSVQKISIDDRAYLIHLIIEKKTEFYSAAYPELPNLLIDKNDKTITLSSDKLMPPEGKQFHLPDGIDLSFISKQLCEHLRSKFAATSMSALYYKLYPFKVEEYSFDVVSRKIVTSINQLIAQHPDDEKKYIIQLHNYLWDIFCDFENKSTPSIPATITSIPIYNRNSIKVNAKTLYFGKEYKSGELAEGLLKAVDDNVFVAPLFSLELEKYCSGSTIASKRRDWEDYLKWLGIMEMPRETKTNFQSNRRTGNNFINGALSELRYPYVTTTGYQTEFKKLTDFDSWWNFSFSGLWFERIEEILSKAPVEYILAWFIKNRNISYCIQNNRDNASATLTFDGPYLHNSRQLRNMDIPSYLLYFLQSFPFLPVAGGKKVQPNQCILSNIDLSPLISAPIIDYTAPIFKSNGINKDTILLFLRKLGVRDGLDELSIDSLYGLLNNHAVSYSNDKGKARPFYELIIEATKDKDLAKSTSFNRSKYLKDGKILASFDDTEEFQLVTKVAYADNPNFSHDLVKQFFIADLPQRSGNNRVRDLFGVTPLDHIEFNVTSSRQNEGLNILLSNELENIKPILFAYRFAKRLTQSQMRTELKAIKEVKIQTSNDVFAEYEAEEGRRQIVLNEYEYVEDQQSSIKHVKIGDQYQTLNNLKNSLRFRETIADIICGALKVTEHRKDFMLLLNEPQSNWVNILSREFKNYHVMEEEIFRSFEGALTNTQLFWKAIIMMLPDNPIPLNLSSESDIYTSISTRFEGITRDSFIDWYRKIDYANLSTKSNLDTFKQLFSIINTDLEMFNKVCPRTINIVPFNENLLRDTYHCQFIKKYRSHLYKTLPQEQSHQFLEKCDMLNTFFNFSRPANSLFFKPEDAHRNAIVSSFSQIPYDEIVATEIIDLDKIYSANWSALDRQLRKCNGFRLDIMQSLCLSATARSMIYFNKTEKIIEDAIKLFNEQSKKENSVEVKIGSGNVKYSENDFDDAFAAIELQVQNRKISITEYTPKKVEKSESKKPPIGGGGYGGNYSGKKLTEEDIGFIGEKYAYEVLKLRYDSVEWISENATRAGLPSEIKGAGCDFRCTVNNTTRFVEVKSSIGSSLEFMISENEIKVGHAKNEFYDILVIRNLLSEQIDFKMLKDIFNYKPDESFLNNEKFTVHNDNFRIKFK